MRVMRNCVFGWFLICSAACAADTQRFPFASVVRHGDTVVATLAGDARWLVFFDGTRQNSRVSERGESFTLRDGALFRLIERHSSYDIKCQISPTAAGLEVSSSFDAHSFGGSTEKKKYFIKTQ
jgi:hypothetical protein